ncbi:hypothetical protein EmuJ_000414900 [Echinococcus multilocularis]|uniref:Uncharacterized protein n=1 Tax=Echinococcus multilocularis TaxID=6211 RepID=A0A068Y436_ECHMU|nr:hypothetical protein EmuJ_000414900 [Echinococcus multilocularis]
MSSTRQHNLFFIKSISGCVPSSLAPSSSSQFHSASLTRCDTPRRLGGIHSAKSTTCMPPLPSMNGIQCMECVCESISDAFMETASQPANQSVRSHCEVEDSTSPVLAVRGSVPACLPASGRVDLPVPRCSTCCSCTTVDFTCLHDAALQCQIE